MNILWEGVKATAGIVGQATVEAGKKGKLQTDLLLISREIDGRKRSFGEELYEFVEPLSQSTDFFAANDRMTETLRGPMLTAQREIAALSIKRGKVQERVTLNESTEKSSYVAPTNMAETLTQAARKAGFVSKSAQLKTELSMVEAQIRDFKQLFGLEMFQILVDLEDIQGWLPTVRDVRSIYDQCRRDIEKIEERRKQKELELAKLGGVPLTSSSEPSRGDPASLDAQGDRHDHADGTTSSTTSAFFRQAAAAEGSSTSYTVPSVPAATATVATEPNNGAPGGGLFGVTAAATTSTYADPFASSSPPTPSTGPPQQQKQSLYSGGPDPFATLNSGQATSSASQPPSQFGSAESFLSNQFSAPPSDPLASSMMNDNSAGSYEQPMGGGRGAFGTSASATADPFDSLDSISNINQRNNNNNMMMNQSAPAMDPFAAPPNNNSSTDNPLFRY